MCLRVIYINYVVKYYDKFLFFYNFFFIFKIWSLM